MDIGIWRSAVTVLSLCLFVGIVVWVYARKNKDHFEEAGKLPPDDE
ncbi:cbb3-type cytochrome c oxidase subunit 3 [Aquabacterium lacunae]|jgi:cytochrome c oxidase cbb3-type subunit IV|uniref:Cbb3-type cytochrome c oxidase subunit 3 n=1 Tax=Aquabacterium lacunae TaxID=2528630 RepID=A0A4V2JFJ8_9BURK|nr:cbb3-type cytochrome c oxidase subunit 3 [Aquabacterium lacunae]TBO28704.1 cbb3-type cytochrome c oxidase subunit 3 [Aquabacterium lacunae]